MYRDTVRDGEGTDDRPVSETVEYVRSNYNGAVMTVESVAVLLALLLSV